MSIRERIIKIVEIEGSQTKFARKTDLKVQTVAKLVNQDGQVRSDTLENILNAYPNLNARWLITGEGEMWEGGEEAQAPSRILKAGDPKPIPRNRRNYLVPVPAQAGYTPEWGQLEAGEMKEVIIPTIVGEARTWEVSGNSMSPLIDEGDWVSGYRVESAERMLGGNIVVIVTRTMGIHLKHAWLKGSRVELMPANYKQEIYDIPAEEVVEIWDVRVRITTSVLPSAVPVGVDPDKVRWLIPVVRVAGPPKEEEKP